MIFGIKMQNNLYMMQLRFCQLQLVLNSSNENDAILTSRRARDSVQRMQLKIRFVFIAPKLWPT